MYSIEPFSGIFGQTSVKQPTAKTPKENDWPSDGTWVPLFRNQNRDNLIHDTSELDEILQFQKTFIYHNVHSC